MKYSENVKNSENQTNSENLEDFSDLTIFERVLRFAIQQEEDLN